MNTALHCAIYGLITGVMGTGIGGLCAFFTDKRGNRFLSSVLEYSAGMMLAVVLSELLPEAFEYANLFRVLTGVLLGVFFMCIIEEITAHRQKKMKKLSKDKQELFTMGITMAIGIAMHNLPEGLAIGSGFDASFSLGLSLALTILIHDIPEGIAMAIPLKCAGMHPLKAALIASLSGIPTGLGALIGCTVGQISESFIAICLSLAAGAMLYVALLDLVPQSKKIYSGRLPSFLNILGVITGIVVSICI